MPKSKFCSALGIIFAGSAKLDHKVRGRRRSYGTDALQPGSKRNCLRRCTFACSGVLLRQQCMPGKCFPLLDHQVLLDICRLYGCGDIDRNTRDGTYLYVQWEQFAKDFDELPWSRAEIRGFGLPSL